MRRVLLLAACSVALLVSACGERSRESSATPAAGTAELPELTSIGQLQRAFDAHAGVPQLVILLSPT